MKSIGFNGGQFGDLCMGLVAARAFKQTFPHIDLLLGISRKYSEIEPLFFHHPLLAGTHIWEGYNNWPTRKDALFIEENDFHDVFNVMPTHTESFWYLHRHQTEELCLMHDLDPPKNLQVELEPWFEYDNYPKAVALSLFGSTRAEDKNLSLANAKKIVDYLQSLNYHTIQLGLPDDPQLTWRFLGPLFDSVKLMLGCRALITIDTGMAWIASGYKQRVLGLYGYNYYCGAKSSVNWQPKNPNAIYLESPNVNDIDFEDIKKSIDTLLNN